MLPALYFHQVMTSVVMVTWDIGSVHEKRCERWKHQLYSIKFQN